MATELSARLAAIVDALPLWPGLRVLEVGCGPEAKDTGLELDGRHPESGRHALQRLVKALAPDGRLFIDGGDPLRELTVPR